MGRGVAGRLEIPHGDQEIYFEEIGGAAGNSEGVAASSQARLSVAAGGLDAQRDERPVSARPSGAANAATRIFQARGCASARARTLMRAQKPLRYVVAHAGAGAVAQEFYRVWAGEGIGQLGAVFRE